MIKEIVKDDPILGQVCEEATADDASVAQDLLDTMETQEDCVCLAANQIGVTKRLFVYRDQKGHTHAVYNPKLMRGLRAQRIAESCLSHEEPTKSRRFDQVMMSYQENVDGRLVPRKKEFRGFMAQAVQHMIDHCDGKLV